MSAIEQRARELLAAAYRETEYPAMVHESHNLMHGRPERRERAALAAIIAALTPPEGFVLIQRVDAKRLVQGDTNSPGYELSCRRVGALLAACPEVP